MALAPRGARGAGRQEEGHGQRARHAEAAQLARRSGPVFGVVPVDTDRRRRRMYEQAWVAAAAECVSPRGPEEEGGNDMSDVIEVRGLVKTYPKGVRALDGLDFGVEAGSVFALLGPNGAGKSTTVKVLTTLSRPDAGEAGWPGSTWCAGRGGASGDRRRRAAVRRRSRRRPGARTCAAGRMYGMRAGALEERVATLLERFELADAADRVASTYSGGMQRRLDVAMGLVHRPAGPFPRRADHGLDPEARALCGRRSSG